MVDFDLENNASKNNVTETDTISLESVYNAGYKRRHHYQKFVSPKIRVENEEGISIHSFGEENSEENIVLEDFGEDSENSIDEKAKTTPINDIVAGKLGSIRSGSEFSNGNPLQKYMLEDNTSVYSDVTETV